MAQTIEIPKIEKQTIIRSLMKSMKVVIRTKMAGKQNKASVEDYQVVSKAVHRNLIMVVMRPKIFNHLLMKKRRKEFNNCGIKQDVTTTNLDSKQDCRRWLSPT